MKGKTGWGWCALRLVQEALNIGKQWLPKSPVDWQCHQRRALGSGVLCAISPHYSASPRRTKAVFATAASPSPITVPDLQEAFQICVEWMNEWMNEPSPVVVMSFQALPAGGTLSLALRDLQGNCQRGQPGQEPLARKHLGRESPLTRLPLSPSPANLEWLADVREEFTLYQSCRK